MVTTIIIIILIILIGCTRNDLSESEISSESAVLTTKMVLDNGDVSDVNIYVFNAVNGTCMGHCFVHDKEEIEKMLLPIGQYEIFAIGNHGQDMGETISVSDIQELKFTLSENNTYLPLFGSTSLLLTENETCDIELKQCAARISFSIKVSDELTDMLIQSVQLKDVAMTGYYSSPYTEVGKLMSTSLIEMSSRTFDTTLYIAENCAGVNSAIKEQREKNQENAPEGASYIQINTISGNRFLNYRVYLGINNTTDFNVRKGSNHRLVITIEGEDEIDTRMESETIDINDNMFDSRFNSEYVFPSDNYRVFITPSNKSQTIDFNLVSGDSRYFTSPSSVSLAQFSNDTSFKVGYNLPVVTSSTSGLRYKVTIRTSEGNVYSKEFSRKFCNLLSVGTASGGGTLDKSYGTSLKYFIGDSIFILTPYNNQALKAICDDGFSLQGWYTEDNQLLSQNEVYTHPFAAHDEKLVMKFKREKVFIYTDLTEVQLICLKREPIINEEKSAYVVDTNVYCEISCKDTSKEIYGWYDEKGYFISSLSIYTFTSDKNRHIYPRFK